MKKKNITISKSKLGKLFNWKSLHLDNSSHSKLQQIK